MSKMSHLRKIDWRCGNGLFPDQQRLRSSYRFCEIASTFQLLHLQSSPCLQPSPLLCNIIHFCSFVYVTTIP